MADAVVCPSCGTRYRVENIRPGAQLRCSRCQSVIPLPASDAAPTSPAAPTIVASNGPVTASGGLVPGTILGRCSIEALLGKGGMGAVYRARHTQLDIPVAVKVLPAHIAAEHPHFAERFLREARMAARIRHPHVVSVLGADRDEGTGLHFIEMEYVDGGSVQKLLEGGPLDVGRALEITRCVAQALVAASEHKVIHRDIKPDNIMLTRKGEVKLADMGLAKELAADNESGITMSHTAMGTPAYMPPEQAEDASSVDARADIYSLGATLYHMLTGNQPYSGKTAYQVLMNAANQPTPDPRQLRPDLPPAVASLCMKMMAKDPNERPTTAEALLADLARVEKAPPPAVRASAPQPAAPPKPAARPVRPAPQQAPQARKPSAPPKVRSKAPFWVWPVGVVAILLLAVFIKFALHAHEQRVLRQRVMAATEEARTLMDKGEPLKARQFLAERLEHVPDDAPGMEAAHKVYEDATEQVIRSAVDNAKRLLDAGQPDVALRFLVEQRGRLVDIPKDTPGMEDLKRVFEGAARQLLRQIGEGVRRHVAGGRPEEAARLLQEKTQGLPKDLPELGPLDEARRNIKSLLRLVEAARTYRQHVLRQEFDQALKYINPDDVRRKGKDLVVGMLKIGAGLARLAKVGEDDVRIVALRPLPQDPRAGMEVTSQIRIKDKWHPVKPDRWRRAGEKWYLCVD